MRARYVFGMDVDTGERQELVKEMEAGDYEMVVIVEEGEQEQHFEVKREAGVLASEHAQETITQQPRRVRTDTDADGGGGIERPCKSFVWSHSVETTPKGLLSLSIH